MLPLRNVFRLSYLFDVHALAFGETAFWIFVAWLGVITAAFIVLRVFVHKKHSIPLLSRFIARVSRGVLTYGIVSAIFLLVRSQEAVFIAMRFWYVLATVIFATWLIYIVVKFTTRYEEERKAHDERVRRESYFSKGKR